MSARSWLIIFLWFWLLLAIARQVFDLVGRLWIPVGFNLLQIVCCLTGLFGAIQKRLSLLIALLISNVISIAQNILIFLWYLGVFGDRTRPVLSAGLPYSFSFFLRFSPGCDSQFDLKSSRWVQTWCPLPYFYIEAAQAVMHIFLASVTFVLGVMMICERRKAKMEPKPVTSNGYSEVNRTTKIPSSPSSINDVSSGYMNSSYEDVNVDPSPIKIEAVPLPISQDRNNKIKKSKYRQNSSQPQLNTESRPEDFYTKPQKSTNNSKSGPRFKKLEQKRRATIHEDQLSPSEEPAYGLSRTASGNMTSLISFDPKSGTLLRVREHVDSDDDSQAYRSYIAKEVGVDVESDYEKIRSLPYASLPLSSREPEPPVSLVESKVKNTSEDSVPSMLAPVLNVNPGSTSSPMPASSIDSGIPWSVTSSGPAKMDPWRTELKNSPRDSLPTRDMVQSPGIRLTNQKPDLSLSPGIRLTHSLAAVNKPHYRSSFQIQTPEPSRIVGHYHAPNEFALTDDDESIVNRPIISGTGLLV